MTVSSHSPFTFRAIVAFALLCVVVGSYFRFYNLGESPYWMDEGYTTLATQTLLTEHSTTLPGGMPYFCGTYCTLSLPVVTLLGITPFSMRFVAAVASVLVVIVVYFFAKKLFTLPVALIATVITSLSYWQIAWGRQARWYSLLSLFVTLSLYFFYSAIVSKSRLHLLISLLFTLLAIKTHYSAILLPVIYLLYAILDGEVRAHVRQFFGARHSVQWYFLLLTSGILLSFVTQGLYYLVANGNAINLFSYYASFYGAHYLTYLLLCLVAIISVLFPSYKKHRSAVLLLVTTVATYLISLSFFSDILHYRYLFLVTPLIFILASFGLYTLITACVTRPRAYTAYTLLFVISLLYLFAHPSYGGPVLARSTFYALESDNSNKLTNRNYYAYTPQPNWNGAYEFIDQNYKSSTKVISSHPHFTYLFLGAPGYWFPSDYLLSRATSTSAPSVDPYVGALPVADVEDLINLTNNNDGYIIFDYQSYDGRLPTDMREHIESHFTLVYSSTTNDYSRVWVYKF